MISHNHVIESYMLDSASSIVDLLYNEIVTEEDQRLLSLVFSNKIEQSDLDEFLKDWDIEKFGERKSLMLSYVMKTNPGLEFPSYEKPRLEGLLKFHRFSNVKLISHYVKVVKALNKADIVPMIFKGGAMKHIRPELSRAMSDIDILVSSEDEFSKACEISKILGYEYNNLPEDHSIDLHLPDSIEGTIDIHRYIYLETDYDRSFLKDLFDRSTKEEVFKTQSFVPCFEDMLFLGLINLARNLHRQTSIHGILFYLFDFKYLSETKEDFNWDLVLNNIVKTQTYAQAILAIKFIHKIIPGLLPEFLLESEVIHKKFVRHCNQIVFNRFYFQDLRLYCKKLSIKKALVDSQEFKDYISHKPKYFIMKRLVRKNDFFIKIFLMFYSGEFKSKLKNAHS